MVLEAFKNILIVSLKQITLWRLPDQQTVGTDSRSLHLQRAEQVLLQWGQAGVNKYNVPWKDNQAENGMG